MSAADIEQTNTSVAAGAAPEPVPAISEKQRQQDQLDILMGVLEDNQSNMPEGDYLRGMNALCSLHKKKGQTDVNTRWLTHDDVCDDEALFERVIDLSEDIVFELNGSNMFDDARIVDSGEETDFLNQVINYQPSEGEAGFGENHILMYQAQRFIYCRLFNDMNSELANLRPAVCQCGWRGTQGNWDRHTNNRRHKNWVVKKNSLFDTDNETDNDTAPEVIIVD
jgi:hypothetical protein